MDQIRKIIRETVERVVLNEELDDATRAKYYARASERKPFSADEMKKAIQMGLEVGLLFKSDNETYKMPVSKYRIIWPVSMGVSKKGNMVVRGYHIIGQSEKEALKTGVRSAEVENEWRMFKTKNIQRMWFTGNVIGNLPNDFNPIDKSMTSVIVYYDKNKAKKLQKSKEKEG